MSDAGGGAVGQEEGDSTVQHRCHITQHMCPKTCTANTQRDQQQPATNDSGVDTHTNSPFIKMKFYSIVKQNSIIPVVLEAGPVF